jgi:acetolactate synthase-1/2/3 large subunit
MGAEPDSFARIDSIIVFMNGAQSLVHTAVESGINICFCNPGTTELFLVAALQERPEMRTVPGLSEGVITGSADGYARLTGRPALVLMHQGPGLANGLANLHNARRARAPVINLVGDQPTWHQSFDPPLAMDITALAKTVGWAKTSTRAKSISSDLSEAIAAATEPPGRVATLIVSSDCQWETADVQAVSRQRKTAPKADEATIARVSAILSGRADAVLLLGGNGLMAPCLAIAHSIAVKTGCRLMCESFPAKLAYGRGLPPLDRLPYMPEMVAGILSKTSALVLCGAEEPVSFFGYPDGVSRPVPEHVPVVSLVEPCEDVLHALESLAAAVGASDSPVPALSPPAIPAGRLTPRSMLSTLAALLPNDSIVIDESMSSGGQYLGVAAGSARHTYLSITGGACGHALPCAVGAAIACPKQKVIAIVGDGSGMYTPQALWTQAREQLDIVNIICANRSYRMLQAEFVHMHGTQPPGGTQSLFHLAEPAIQWANLGKSLGLRGMEVGTIEELVAALNVCFSEPGPFVLEVQL